MDVADEENHSYNRVSQQDACSSTVGAGPEEDHDDEISSSHHDLSSQQFIDEEVESDSQMEGGATNRASFSDQVCRFLSKTLLPDNEIAIGRHLLLEGSFSTKLLKFILSTFVYIAIVHVIVKKLFHDRDRDLKLWHIWVYESNLIVMDSIVFFLVGRLWRQKGVDQGLWLLMVAGCNLYFESQNFVPWLQHSVTLYEMHCRWPWQLWAFVLVMIPLVTCSVLLHVARAVRKGLLLTKILELVLVAFFFVVPLLPSSYFHFHHWYAGWLLGQHCNFDVWWSRMLMAWCWGMYINGIAVYGRDPVLTCEYAFFLSKDNHCPYVQCYLDALQDMADHPDNATHVVQKMEPVDWRNCSAAGFHP